MSIKSEIRLIEQKLLPVKNNNFNLDSLSDWTGTTAEDAVGSFFTHSKITNSVRSKNNFTTPPTVEESTYTEDDRTLKQSLPYDYDVIASEPFPNCKAIRVDYKIFGITNTGDTQYTFYLENLSGTTRTENGDYYDIFYIGTTTTTTTLPPTTTTTTTPTTTTTTTLPPYTGITGDALIENRIFFKPTNEEIVNIKTAFPMDEVPKFNNVPNDWGWTFSGFNLDTRLENEVVNINGWLINYTNLITSDGDIIDLNGNFLPSGVTYVDEQSVLKSEVLAIVKGSGFDGDIKFVYKQLNNRYIVGGDFLNYNGEQFRYIMRLLPNGDPDYSFNRDGEGFSENIIGWTETNGVIEYHRAYVNGIYNDYNGNMWVTGAFYLPVTYNDITIPQPAYNSVSVFLMDFDGNDILFSYVTNPLAYKYYGAYSTSYDYLERTLTANTSYNLVPRMGDLLAMIGGSPFLFRNDGTGADVLQQGGPPITNYPVTQIEIEKLPIEIGVYTNEFGYIAHIYEPGEEGYIDGFVSGFGVSTEDLNPNLWFDSYVGEVWGCNNFLGATTTNGYYNSNLLYNSGCGLIETLKTVNQDVFLLRDNSTSHFYIPSKEEMLIIHQNLSTILNYYGSYSNYYWTSTEVNAIQVYCFDISDGSFHIISKSNIGRTLNGTPLPTLNVTPIRYFRVKKPILF